MSDVSLNVTAKGDTMKPITNLLLILLVLVVAPYDMAHAETGPYLTIGGGFTAFTPTTADGDFVQRGLPHNYKWAAPVFKVGVGWNFSDTWAAELRYVNAGSNGYDSNFVSDLSYNPKTHTCAASCNTPGFLRARDYVQGFDLTVLRTFTSYEYRPYLRLGAALMLHRLDVNIWNHPINAAPDSQTFIRTDGRIPMLVAGVGVKHGHFTLESTLYYGLGGPNCLSPCGFPQSTQFVTTMVGFNW